MNWFEGSKPLDENNVYYDLFTISKPTNTIKKKIRRSKSVSHVKTAPREYTRYDMQAKKPLRSATNFKKIEKFSDEEALDSSQHIILQYEAVLEEQQVENSVESLLHGSDNKVVAAAEERVCTQEEREDRSRILDSVVESDVVYKEDNVPHRYSRVEEQVEPEWYEISGYIRYVNFLTTGMQYERVTAEKIGAKRPFRRTIKQFEQPPEPHPMEVAEVATTVVLSLNTNENIHNTFEQAESEFNASETRFRVELAYTFLPQCAIYWEQSVAVSAQLLSQLRPGQLLNHFVGVNTIVEKDSFYKKMRALAFYDASFQQMLIPTYIVPHQLHGLLRDSYGRNLIFIVKPTSLSRGRGIFLSRDPMSFKDCKSVVEFYIENPLLLMHRKIDFRVYVLLLGESAYLYEDGLVRSAGSDFTLQSLDNAIHLTNTSLSTSGGKITLQKYLSCVPGDRELIVRGIKKAAQAVKRISRRITQQNCFELLGCDVLFDQHFNPYLIEVNSSPNLRSECAADRVKASMICDILRLVLTKQEGKWTIIE